MSDKNIITLSANKFSEHYEDNPVASILLTALSLAVPQLAIGKEAIDRAVTKIQQERFRAFIDELATGEKYLTSEIIETEEFIHSFVGVYRAVINTYQREKIRLFARILLSAVEKDELASDSFDMFVRILEDMSYRELSLLRLLQQFETNDSLHGIVRKDDTEEPLDARNENALQRTNRFWDKFIDDGCELLDCETEILVSILTALSRTGLYETFAGAFLDYSGGKGQTTLLFKNFSDWIKFEDETNIFLYKDEDTTSD